jgi:hypothetical protein
VPELVAALISWAILLIMPRWWLLAVCAFIVMTVAAMHAGAEAGDLILYALLGVVPAVTVFFAAIGALIVWARKAVRRSRASGAT